MQAGCGSLSRLRDVWMLCPLSVPVGHRWLHYLQGVGSVEVTEDHRPSCNTVATTSSRGPKAQDEDGAEAQAHEETWRTVPVPKGQQNGIGEKSPGNGPSASPDPPPSPT